MISLSPRIKLAIACWGGARRTPHQEYDEDRSYYLKLQIDSLQKFRHQWTDVTFVSNGGEPDYVKYFEDTVVPNFNVIVRSDIGMSYGAFNSAWQTDRSYDYYIFLEDDFLFIKEDFDQLMVKIFETTPNCGYLCQLAWGKRSPHPAIFNGMANKQCLERLNVLPGADQFDNNSMLYYGKVETKGQKAWGDKVAEIGLVVSDMGSHYRAPFVEADGSLICWHPNAPGYIISPAQCYHKILNDPNYIENYSITDEDWRAFRTYYLLLKNVYLSDEDRARFVANVSPCRMKTREDLARAVSIYDGLSRNRTETMRKELINFDQYIESMT